jgi:hydroxypyruvate isomerase
MLFTEQDFLARFEAAAKAGFSGVEYLFPYDFSSAEIKAKLDANGLTQVLFNLPAGDWAKGERGIACLPDRVEEFRAGVDLAIAYARCWATPRSTAWPASARKASTMPPWKNLRRQPQVRGRQAAGGGHQTGDGSDQHPRHPGLLPEQHGASPVDSRAGRQRQPVPAIRHLPHANHGRRSGPHPAIAPGRDQPRAARGQPGRNEPGTGEINYRFLFEHLDRIGYQGWVGCEYKPLTTTEAGLGWLKTHNAI